MTATVDTNIVNVHDLNPLLTNLPPETDNDPRQKVASCNGTSLSVATRDAQSSKLRWTIESRMEKCKDGWWPNRA
jgi:hypothetical protein